MDVFSSAYCCCILINSLRTLLSLNSLFRMNAKCYRFETRMESYLTSLLCAIKVSGHSDERMSDPHRFFPIPVISTITVPDVRKRWPVTHQKNQR